jgi:beta-RFAP synthase
MRIDEAIPGHIGLGSGTQLGMAVAKVLSALVGENSVKPSELARRVNRGRRSALGIHGFATGGFLVDGGKRTEGDVGALLDRADFPVEWRFVLVTPADATGLSGNAELDAFARLPAMPAGTTGRLCSILLLELLPAVLEADFDTCGAALYEFGRLVGDYFAPVQGGTYATPATTELVRRLRQRGIRGVGQTSWGPTLFALCPDPPAAEELKRDLAASRWCDCRFSIAAPLNRGALVRLD